MHIDNNIFEFYFKCSFNYKRTYYNPIWKIQRKIYLFYCKQINNCYNLYYKLSGKQIIGPIERLQLQRLLESKDPENKILGISFLINYYAGTDLLDHCSYRMYDGDGIFTPKKWYKVGKVQLHEHTRIQELIDALKETYDYFSQFNDSKQLLYECYPYLNPIGYWMAYSRRIGSNVCSPLGEFNTQGGRKSLKLMEGRGTFHEIYTWDWRRRKYDYAVDADEYWKTHKKPDLSVL